MMKVTKEPTTELVVQQPGAVLTPMAMIDRAISSGAAVEVLEKLFALQERYEANQARKDFNNAIADAKAEIKPIFKNRKVDFTSQKGRTNYDYEDLAQIANQVDPILSKHGLSYRHRSAQDGLKLSVTCIMSHRGGFSEETTLAADNDGSGNKNSIQAIGSTATFLQRYTLKLALGLATTKDDDAQAVSTGGPITDAQVDEIIALADQVGADKPKFCEWLKVPSIADIQQSQFKRAVAKLKEKGRHNAAGQ
jgi:hypothetical protein